jgi:hypothetical protein
MLGSRRAPWGYTIASRTYKWEEHIEDGAEQVEGVVVGRVGDHPEREQESTRGSPSGAREPCEDQRHAEDERDPVIAKPCPSDRFRISVLFRKNEPR